MSSLQRTNFNPAKLDAERVRSEVCGVLKNASDGPTARRRSQECPEIAFHKPAEFYSDKPLALNSQNPRAKRSEKNCFGNAAGAFYSGSSSCNGVHTDSSATSADRGHTVLL